MLLLMVLSHRAGAQFLVFPSDTACVYSAITFTDPVNGVSQPCGPHGRAWTIAPATGWVVLDGEAGLNNGGSPEEWLGTTLIVVQFTSSGSYVIGLTSGNSCGTSIQEHSICIEEPPVPTISLPVDPGCAPLMLQVANLTPDAGCDMDLLWNVNGISATCDGVIAWYFNNGTTAGSFEPSIHFTTAGVYEVVLEVTNSCGSFTTSGSITVNGLPSIAITAPAAVCAGTCITPTAIVGDCGLATSMYSWSFPGAQPATFDGLVPGTICYGAATTTSISLSATNACGTRTGTVPLSVGGSTITPVVSANSPVCNGQVLSLTATVPPGTPVLWSGPNNFASTQTIVTIPNAGALHAGIYTATAGTAACPGGSASVVVQVISSPTVSVTPLSSAICAGEQVVLTASGAGTYQWYSGNTLVHTGEQFMADPSTTTVYTVTGSMNGCSATATTTVIVHALPQVDAGPPQTFCDQAIPVQLPGTPAGGTWSGNGVTPTGGFTPVPGMTGSYPLSYSFTNANGCTAASGTVVTVQPLSVIADAGPDASFCQGVEPVLLPASPAGGTWTGAGANGEFLPEVPGSYLLAYAYGTGTCATSDQVQVTVHELPEVDMGPDIAICIDAGTQMLSAFPINGLWSGAGVDPVTGIFDPWILGAGVNTIAYTVDDALTGCSNTGTMFVAVDLLPVAAFQHSPLVCVGMPVVFINSSENATAWSWSFGDGTSAEGHHPSHVYQQEGEYLVTLSASTGAGCTDVATSLVVVWDQPQAQFTLDVHEGCGPLSITPVELSTGQGLDWSWDLGPAGVSGQQDPGSFVLHADAGAAVDHSITLTVSNACGVSAAVEQVLVIPPPTAVIQSPSDTWCSHAEVVLENASLGSPDLHEWDLGDGTLSGSNGQVIHHTYIVESVQTSIPVTLVASNSCGSDTAAITLTILPNEVTSAFSASTVSGCAPLIVGLTQLSTGDTAWHWAMGDGSFSIEHDPVHTYHEPGTYVVTLQNNGCGYDQSSMVIDVLAPPDPGFTFSGDGICEHEIVLFQASHTGAATFHWDLGEGQIVTGAAVEHSFFTSGDHPVTLSVNSIANGCSASHMELIAVQEAPIAGFTAPGSGCAGTSMAFLNTSIGGQSHQWWFAGDGPLTGGTLIHDIEVPGDHVVTLVVEGANGCTDTTSSIVVVHPLPLSSFTLSSYEGCVAPAMVTTSNFSEGAGSYAWNAGGIGESTLQEPEWLFSSPGSYIVQLTVVNEFGCTDSSSATFTLHQAPVATFSVDPASACLGEAIRFINGSQNSTGHRWWFGDGAIATIPSPIHAYDHEGIFDVTLVSTGAGGCSDTITVPAAVTIHPLPEVGFEYSPSATMANVVQFNSTSTGASDHHWDLGGGMTSGLKDLRHEFAEEGGRFTICLRVENEFSCADEVCREIVITGGPYVQVPNAFTPNSDGLNDIFLPMMEGFEDREYRLEIFDRLGVLIHATRDRSEGWDGSINGREGAMGVYVWRVILGQGVEAREYSGHVSLVR